MKLIVKGKLVLEPEQRVALIDTVARMNVAANWLSEEALAAQDSNKFRLQRDHYRTLRERFGLSAQMAIRTLSKVADAYRRDLSTLRVFRIRGAVAYDAHLYSFRESCSRVSLSTLSGRVVVPVRFRESDRTRLFNGKWGEADVLIRDKQIYLAVSVEVDEGAPVDTTGYLGVDLGVVNIATDSDGEIHSAHTVLARRKRSLKLRGQLQSAGSRSARRHLKKLSGRERRFVTHVNHEISKSLVRKAKDTGRGIALEDLTHLRERATARRRQRSVLHTWAFRQLRHFCEYKAGLSGIPCALIDPRDTSRTCPVCWHCDPGNRRSQAEFVCKGCGFVAHADVVGARNIASRADVIRPIVSGAEAAVNR